jgi:hypothetical protein
LLRGAELAPAYEEAFLAGDGTDDAAEWDATVGDHLR